MATLYFQVEQSKWQYVRRHAKCLSIIFGCSIASTFLNHFFDFKFATLKQMLDILLIYSACFSIYAVTLLARSERFYERPAEKEGYVILCPNDWDTHNKI